MICGFDIIVRVIFDIAINVIFPDLCSNYPPTSLPPPNHRRNMGPLPRIDRICLPPSKIGRI